MRSDDPVSAPEAYLVRVEIRRCGFRKHVWVYQLGHDFRIGLGTRKQAREALWRFITRHVNAI